MNLKLIKKGEKNLRVLLKFNMKTNFLPLDYHKFVVSYIKKALTDYEGGKFFGEFYSKNISNNYKKDFSWSMKIPNPAFFKNRIEVDEKYLEITFITPSKTNSAIFLNAFLLQKGKVFAISKENEIALVDITMLKEPTITQNMAHFKLYSPLVLREHYRDTNRDRYFTVEDEDFVSRLKENIRTSYPKYASYVDELKIDVSKLHKEIIPLYGVNIEVSIGDIIMLGEPKLLDTILKGSLGLRKASGFGVLKLVDSWRFDV